MKLSKEQQNKLIAKLNSFGSLAKCTVCGNSNWNISDTVFEMREFQGGNLVLGGNQGIYPVIPLTCSTCGNTHFLNAVLLDVLDPQKKEEQNG